MIHISEIAAGRIRNIRDYVKEGKKVVCKVLRVREQKGHVDLSLRRVNDSQRRKKVNSIKLEQKAESIINYVAEQNGLKPKELYDNLADKVLEDYEYMHLVFEDIERGEFDIKALGLDKNMTKQLNDLIVQRFKPKPIMIEGELELSTYHNEGIDIIKEALKKAGKGDGVEIMYLGGGRYKITVTAKDYKAAEPIMDKAVKAAIEYVEKNEGKGSFQRTDD